MNGPDEAAYARVPLSREQYNSERPLVILEGGVEKDAQYSDHIVSQCVEFNAPLDTTQVILGAEIGWRSVRRGRQCRSGIVLRKSIPSLTMAPIVSATTKTNKYVCDNAQHTRLFLLPLLPRVQSEKYYY